MGTRLRDLDFDDDMLRAPGKGKPSAPAPEDFTPTTGKALFAWAKKMTPKAKIDILVKVKEWGKDHDCPPDLFRWSPASVSSCHADLVSIMRIPHDGPPVPSPGTFVPVRSDPVPVAQPRPLTAISQPFSGKALRAWAIRSSANLGVDFLAWIEEWTKGLPYTLFVAYMDEWDIKDVTDCFAAMAKRMDEAKLLNIPPEARAQMPQERVPSDRVAGPLTIDPRDPFKPKKLEIKETAKRVFRATSKDEPTELAVMEFLQGHCRRFGLAVPESIRNLSVSSHLHMIMTTLQESELELGLF
jgi:hypothetical protein